MLEQTGTGAAPKAPADPMTDDLVKKWTDAIEGYQKEYKHYHERAKKILKRYRGESTPMSEPLTGNAPSKFNVFWSNVETMKPALYARTPKPQVERKFRDADPVGRVASNMLERGLSYSIREYDFDSVIRQVRDDYLRIGRGISWVRYVPKMAPMENEAGEPVLDQETQEPVQQVVYEEVLCEYVYWEDFLHDPVRTWQDVKWVARRVYLTKMEARERFGAIADKLSYTKVPKLQGENNTGVDAKRAEIFEVWDKETRHVVWISKDYKEAPLQVQDDPLRLKNFFPCPRPLYATLTTDSLVPLPDYAMYQDQANELDELTSRISLLTQALRVAGVYDVSCEGVQDLLKGGYENKLVPVKNWPAFANQGGLNGAVQFFPLQDIVAALTVLQQRATQVKNDLYEVTGISDIIRGASNPAETATAQQLKGQFATLRISDRQYEMQRYVRDVLEIKGEIMAEQFSPETLSLIADVQVDTPENQQLFQQAYQLIKNQSLREFRIDIETDSTIAMDEQAEKQARQEFVQVIGGFLQQSQMFIQQAPMYANAMNEILMFLARGYKAGRSLEAALEQAGQQMLQMLQQKASQPPQPSPDQVKAQQDMQLAQQKQQNDLQIAQAKAQNDMQIAQVKEASRQEIERIKTQADIEAKKQSAQIDMLTKLLTAHTNAQQPRPLNAY